MKVPVFSNIGKDSACDAEHAQNTLNNFHRNTRIFSLEESRVDNEHKSDNIVAQAHQKPFSSHEETVVPYLVCFRLKLLWLYEIVTSSSFGEKVSVLSHKASSWLLVISIGFYRLYWHFNLRAVVLRFLVYRAECWQRRWIWILVEVFRSITNSLLVVLITFICSHFFNFFLYILLNLVELKFGWPIINFSRIVTVELLLVWIELKFNFVLVTSFFFFSITFRRFVFLVF
jgi:hypothetical protein